MITVFGHSEKQVEKWLEKFTEDHPVPNDDETHEPETSGAGGVLQSALLAATVVVAAGTVTGQGAYHVSSGGSGSRPPAPSGPGAIELFEVNGMF